jgi:hypothetical protein
MNTPKELTIIDGTEYIRHKNQLKEYAKHRLKHRRKKFVRIVKRAVSGPFLGCLLAFLSYQFFNIPALISLAGAVGITAIGLTVRYRYIKYVYLTLVIGLYAFLITQMILQ